MGFLFRKTNIFRWGPPLVVFKKTITSNFDFLCPFTFNGCQSNRNNFDKSNCLCLDYELYS